MKKFELNDFQAEIMNLRYALPSENSWDDLVNRVAKHLSQAETNDDMTLWEKRFKWIMSNGYYFPGGRVLYGSGRRIGGLLNCFCKDVEDNRHSIAALSHDMYLISTFGGGLGTNYSKIRPMGDPIQGVLGSAPGVVSEIKKIDAIGEQVRSGGNRRTALMASLNIDHPDILEFLEVKLESNQLTNHNISINITREFIAALENDDDWHFKFNGKSYFQHSIMRQHGDTNLDAEILVMGVAKEEAMITAKNFYKTHYLDTFEYGEIVPIKARDLWKTIVENSVKSGEPGLIFIDNMKDNFATSYFEDYVSVNPCAEAVLPADGNCNLGSLNLSRMYNEETNDVDWKLLSKVVRHAIRALDNVLTMNIFPTTETKIVAERSRRVGLGTMGLHHLLIKMGITYGSDSSLEFIERLYTTIRNEAFDASIDIAKEKGSFQEYDYSEYTKNQYIKKLPSRLLNKMKVNGIRNAVLLSVAPNGTISMLAGTSSGIEPIFAPMYLRKYRKEGAIAKEVVVDNMFDEFVRSGKSYEHIVGAYDVTPEQHLAVQAAVQDSTDQAISKTINLPREFEAEALMDIILKFAERLKGMTVYRAGSRGDEPLTALSPTKANVKKYISVDSHAGVVNPDCATGSCEI